MSTYKISCLVLLLSICFKINGQGKNNGQESDTLKKNQLFELSFGQSLLFISNSKLLDIRNKEAVVIPTSSILFFVEFRPQKKIRIPLFFNLPTETKQFLINNQLINERASPTFGAGIEYKFFQVQIDAESSLDFESGLLASFLISNRNVLKVVPVIAGRIRIMRGENFVLYIGSTYSIGIDTWGILYGTGTIF